MSVSKDKTGKWYAVVKQKNPYSGQTEWKKKRGFSTKREAQAWEADILRTESSSLPEFSIIADEYLKSMDTSINTANQKRAKYRLYFSEYLHTPIDKITKPELQRWRNNLGDQKLSTQTKNLTLQYVKAVFLYASKVYGIENNAVMLKTFKKTDAEINCEMQTWSAAEFNQFLSVVDLPVYRLYFEFLYWTGCRRGEALAITKDRISPDGKVVIKESILICVPRASLSAHQKGAVQYTLFRASQDRSFALSIDYSLLTQRLVTYPVLPVDRSTTRLQLMPRATTFSRSPSAS